MVLNLFSLNIFLNWIFIYGNLGIAEMGVSGAGLATAISSTLLTFFTMITALLYL